ncbi:MAG: DUF2784 family protein [Burkholderiaceae bacterium]|nr:DUF2784 family protein [Burkholderiaceae bacterium]
MVWSLLASGVLALHLAFIAFAIGAGLLVIRWPRVAWAHVPALAWAALIEFAGGICPLTPLEVWLLRRAGESGYSGGFIEHYLTAIVYPDGLTRAHQVALGTAVLAVNALVYWRVLARRN